MRDNRDSPSPCDDGFLASVPPLLCEMTEHPPFVKNFSPMPFLRHLSTGTKDPFHYSLLLSLPREGPIPFPHAILASASSENVFSFPFAAEIQSLHYFLFTRNGLAPSNVPALPTFHFGMDILFSPPL